MCKDKSRDLSVMFEGKTLGEGLCLIGQQVAYDVLEVPNPQKIDWSNLRLMIAAFLEKFGPIILPLVIGWMTPKETE